MPLYVGIYTIKNRKNNLAGVICLTEDGLSTEPQPGFENLLSSIVRETIQDPKTKQFVRALTNPEQWMRALCFHLKSAYLRASEATLVKPTIPLAQLQTPLTPTAAPPPASGENAINGPQTAPDTGTVAPPPQAAPTPQG